MFGFAGGGAEDDDGVEEVAAAANSAGGFDGEGVHRLDEVAAAVGAEDAGFRRDCD